MKNAYHNKFFGLVLDELVGRAALYASSRTEQSVNFYAFTHSQGAYNTDGEIFDAAIAAAQW